MDLGALTLSVLELAPVEAGSTAADALAATVELARRVERLGYRRIWVAEHHSAPSIASSAPAVLIGRIADATSTIRVGSGGVMLPNHSPLAVAEQFATLDALHPRRIDLGFGRGPGTTDAAAVADLRHGAPPATDEDYDRDVRALLAHLVAGVLPAHRTGAAPWALASSTKGAALAGTLGLPLAVAHHIRPENTLDAVAGYRAAFRPSRWSETPTVTVCATTICAETDAEAADLALPTIVLAAGLLAGRTVAMPTPEQARAAEVSAEFHAAYAARRQLQGSPATVRRQAEELVAATGATELMLLTTIYDLDTRTRSMELVREALA